MIKLTDMMNEEWSEKYKRSINCDNPKGFSQKAHCQGKEKNESQSIDLSEGVFKIGYKHLIPLIPTGYAPNDPKYKADLRYLRNMLNNFYKDRGYNKVILPTF